MSIWSRIDPAEFVPSHRRRSHPSVVCMVVARAEGWVQSVDVPGIMQSWTPTAQFAQMWEPIPREEGGLLSMLNEIE